jgi:hypothetical protein
MSKKYTYSRTTPYGEFTAVEFDSFDEAIKAVEKGINEKKVEEIQKAKVNPVIPSQPSNAEIRKDTTAGPGVGTTTTPVINH